MLEVMTFAMYLPVRTPINRFNCVVKKIIIFSGAALPVIRQC